MYYPFVKDERVDDELNFALSAFIFAVSRRFVSLNEFSQVINTRVTYHWRGT